MNEPAKATAGGALSLIRAVNLQTQPFKLLVESLWDFGQLGSVAVPEFLDAFANPAESPFTRHWAMYLVRQNGGMAMERTHEVLLAAIADPSPVVRRSALDALGSIGDSSFIPVIASCLADQEKDDGSWDEADCTVAHAAAEALRKIGTPEALEALGERS